MKLKKAMPKFFALLIVLSTILSLTPVFALATDNTTEAAAIAASEESVTRAEECEIHFATIGGVRHYRIWSLTYGYWKTDWIPCT